jgi:hypothetical protein
VPQQSLSFGVSPTGLAELRLLHGKLVDAGVEPITPIDHGVAWSLYFPDPEGNNLEAFVDTPWYIQQPCAEPLDMSLDDDTLAKRTHELCRRSKGYRPYADWRAEVAPDGRARGRRLQGLRQVARPAVGNSASQQPGQTYANVFPDRVRAEIVDGLILD